ncbi:MAG: hypothetical protein COV46_04020 [Deltaproteobacteria bacterium CG11_big_fil_rev_8_21_14_0_20_49_13]|nr:MAG: hypothetical protein COV46_04020 [Deltaproteobacteria bacterium CG11_big_fil_rev_8_21_14_0_20_49_13]
MLKVLITAGPTREYLDPVRYISNDSSGAMGLALARSATALKASVTLIHGHIKKYPPLGVRPFSVVSGREMFESVKKCYRSADIIICAAAVADFRPAKYSRQKIKKTHALTHLRTYALHLIPNPDILAWLGKHKRKNQLLIGFALETDNLVKNAYAKLKAKNCDIIVANMANVIGKESSSATVITRTGLKFSINNRSKNSLAKTILKFAQKYQKC